MAIYPINQAVVKTKSTWAGAWVDQPALEPIMATDCVAPEIPVAVLRQRYGRVKLQGEAALTVQAPLDVLDKYVLIMCADPLYWWMGVAAQCTYDCKGPDAADPTGYQEITCYGLAHLLDRKVIDTGYCDAGGAEKVIGHCPTFNLRHSKGATLAGNRLMAKASGNWRFSRDGAIWSHYNIIEYLLSYHVPNGPTWSISAASNLIADLDQIWEVVDLDGLTVLQALNRLIDRRRGYGWCLRPTDTEIEIHVFSLFDTDVVSGDNTYHANAEQTTMSLGAGQDTLEAALVRRDRSVLYDTVRARGARVKSCFTVSFNDSTLQAGWTAAQQAAYLAAASGDPGYANLAYSEKEKANDSHRSDDARDRVFSLYRIPAGWNWMVGGGYDDGEGAYPLTTANPTVTDAGALEAVSAPAFDFDRPLLAALPLEEGKAYGVAGYPSALPTNSEPTFRKPLALVRDAAGKWRYVDALGDSKLPDAQVQAARREMALWVRFRPGHILGLGRWTGAAPSRYDPAFGYTTLLATVAVETDHHLHVVVDATGSPLAQYSRELVIDVPDAELWYVAANTVIGLDSAGNLQRIVDADGETGGYVVLRNDVELLRDVAALALKWYGVERCAVQFRVKNLEDYGAPGVFITTAEAGVNQSFSINAVVTRRTWDFAQHTTTVECGWWDPDLARMSGVPRYPDRKAITNALDHALLDVSRVWGWHE